MSLEHDIEKKANEKIAGLMDTLGDAYDSVSGNLGTLSTPLMGAGGALLGGMAGRGLGMGAVGSGLGALLGGGMGAAGSNAINTQSTTQDTMDKALINGVSAGLLKNDQTDQMQNEVISQNNMMMGQILQSLDGLSQVLGGGMGMAPEDPSMEAPMDAPMEGPPGMGGGPGAGMGMGPGGGAGGGFAQMGMGPGGGKMDGSGMPPMQGAPLEDEVSNNGLGTKQGSFEEAVVKSASKKLAKLIGASKNR